MIGWMRRRIGRGPDEETEKLKRDAERRQAALRRDVARVVAIRKARRGA